ncbi:MAG: hypothetical protein IPL63_12340 [Saprospiraceae bacterium]|nr:hypothetical protein [Saprospiraceae bacterium]
MKNTFLVLSLLLLTINANAQNEVKNTYWQAKVDFLEPLVNQGFVARFDYGKGRHLIGIVGGLGGRVSEFDNEQFDTYQDITKYRLGLEYQFFLSKNKQNRGFYIGGDIDFASRTVESKISNESVKNIAVFTPGVWIGYLWKPFKKANLIVDLTIIHPRYDLGNIDYVAFQTVAKPYEPQNLFNFLGPWSIGWRF